MSKSDATGAFCKAPTINTIFPYTLSQFGIQGPGSATVPISMDFGTCDAKAIYNVTINLSDGLGNRSGVYLKAVHP
jgi:hypothetical protein